MTTIGAARAELIAAIIAAGADASSDPSANPPCVYVAGDGTSDLNRVMAGQANAGFRLTMIGGAWDQSAAAAELDTLKQAVLTAVRELPGWRFTGPIGPDGMREVAGGMLLTADAFAERLVDI